MQRGICGCGFYLLQVIFLCIGCWTRSLLSDLAAKSQIRYKQTVFPVWDFKINIQK